MSPSVVIHRAPNAESALVLANYLQSQGFDASLDNFGHAALDWSMIPALGGISVRIPRAQVEDAKSALREALEAAAQDPEFSEVVRKRPSYRWLAWSMIAVWFGLAQVVLGLLLYGVASLLPAKWLTDQARYAGCVDVNQVETIPNPNDMVWIEGHLYLCSETDRWSGSDKSALALIFLGAVLCLVVAEYFTRPSKLKGPEYPNDPSRHLRPDEHLREDPQGRDAEHQGL